MKTKKIYKIKKKISPNQSIEKMYTNESSKKEENSIGESKELWSLLKNDLKNVKLH